MRYGTVLIGKTAYFPSKTAKTGQNAREELPESPFFVNGKKLSATSTPTLYLRPCPLLIVRDALPC